MDSLNLIATSKTLLETDFFGASFFQLFSGTHGNFLGIINQN